MVKINNIAFENEIILVDAQWKPVNFVGNQKCSAVILETLQDMGYQKEYTNGSIAWELDASQIEIKNAQPHKYLATAQEELVRLFGAVRNAANEHGLYISDNVVPNQDYIPEHSWLKDRYSKIHDMLMDLWIDVRKWTNIAWLHVHFQEDESFVNHRLISNYFHELFAQWKYSDMLMSGQRHMMYAKVVDALLTLKFVQTNYMPLLFTNDNIRSQIIDEKGDLIFNYRYVQVKKPGNKYTTEVRTPDAATNENAIVDITSRIYDIVKNI